MGNLQPIAWWQLCLCLGFVLTAGLASMMLRLGLGKDLLWGSVRTFAQLFLVGFVLKYIFAISNVWLVLVYFLWMLLWAAHTIRGRVKGGPVHYFWPTFLAMTVSYLCVTVIVVAVILQVDPWYEPQYFIPIGGMILGNGMDAMSIALERLLSGLREGRARIELALSLGATYREASDPVVRQAVRAGMIPSINALMTVGLVKLPGMMTGQILAGAEPMLAIRYQIVVMLMLVASTALGTVIVVQVVRRLCFTRAHQPRL